MYGHLDRLLREEWKQLVNEHQTVVAVTFLFRACSPALESLEKVTAFLL